MYVYITNAIEKLRESLNTARLNKVTHRVYCKQLQIKLQNYRTREALTPTTNISRV